MKLGTRLQHWWQRMRGEGQPTARPVRPAARGAVRAAARTATPIEGSGAAGELNLSVEGAPTATKGGKEPLPRSAGFDPYSNAGGHAKPSGWDNVPRK